MPLVCRAAENGNVRACGQGTASGGRDVYVEQFSACTPRQLAAEVGTFGIFKFIQ